MDTTNAAVGIALLTVAGRWSQGKKLDIRVGIGMAGLALGLAAINQSQPEIASKLALLVLLSAVFLYGPAIARKAGLIK